MKIICTNNMINIDSKNLSYSNIKRMYELGDCQGLQLSKLLEKDRDLILTTCSDIADKIYELERIINETRA